jgi:hypothetical protein
MKTYTFWSEGQEFIQVTLTKHEATELWLDLDDKNSVSDAVNKALDEFTEDVRD